jgi:hypothetical protein
VSESVIVRDRIPSPPQAPPNAYTPIHLNRDDLYMELSTTRYHADDDTFVCTVNGVGWGYLYWVVFFFIINVITKVDTHPRHMVLRLLKAGGYLHELDVGDGTEDDLPELYRWYFIIGFFLRRRFLRSL